MNPGTITVCTKNTKNLSSISREADVLISATGIPNLITKGMIKDGATVIDVGINRVMSAHGSSHIVGDVDTKEAFKVASYLAKCPNGVGQMTVAGLIENVLIAYRLQMGDKINKKEESSIQD